MITTNRADLANNTENRVDTSAYQQALDTFIDDFDQVAGTVLATEDGLLVASAVRSRGIEVDSIAAMSTSMLSLADAMAGQAGNACADKLISESEASTLVVLHAGSLILTVIGKANVNTGLIFSAARKTAQVITALVEKMGAVSGSESVSDPAALVDKVKREIEKIRLVNGVKR